MLLTQHFCFYEGAQTRGCAYGIRDPRVPMVLTLCVGDTDALLPEGLVTHVLHVIILHYNVLQTPLAQGLP
ncbi:hypothetical protein FKM82_002307 [Ascaphus truei]